MSIETREAERKIHDGSHFEEMMHERRDDVERIRSELLQLNERIREEKVRLKDYLEAAEH